jgi:predicted adenine nucleotide alpha hydrolase (AANH) superfamily ATPase
MKQNYQLMLDECIRSQQQRQQVPRLLLHSCCAPCSSYVLEYLSEYFSITVFYYNPNIYPDQEYAKRVEEQKRFIRELPAKHPIGFVEGDFQKERFFQAVEEYRKEPEGGKRCEICFRLRLEETARLAAEQSYDYFTTTLSISPRKDAALLNAIGAQLQDRYGVNYLFSDFKKRNGYLRSVELSGQYGLYRQDYCGCVFSWQERHGQKEE